MSLRRRLRRRAERGAVATIVAVFLAGGVLVGMAAFSVDVGSLLGERRQLQNGADAAALALAQTCSTTPARCTTANASTAAALAGLADGNADDGTAALAGTAAQPAAVCWHDAGTLPASVGALPACGPAGTGPVDCPALPSVLTDNPDIPYVEVRTATAMPDGSTLFPTPFAATFADGSDGTAVRACARAAWGAAQPPRASVLPVTISYCDWKLAVGADPDTGTGGHYAAGPTGAWPGYDGSSERPWPDESDLSTIWTKGNPTTCPTWNGHTAPGGFAALANPGDCVTDVTADSWIAGDPGNDLPCSRSDLDAAQGTVVHIPVFDCNAKSPDAYPPAAGCRSGKGRNNYYHVVGFSAFYVNGWRLSGDTKAGLRPGTTLCSGGDRCISGWFLHDLVPLGEIVPPGTGGTPDLGLRIVKSVG